MKPHSAFELFRADEVAETWEGVPQTLYATLWNRIVPLQTQTARVNKEDNGPNDVIGIDALSMHWDKLTKDEQRILNLLAERNMP